MSTYIFKIKLLKEKNGAKLPVLKNMKSYILFYSRNIYSSLLWLILSVLFFLKCISWTQKMIP